MYVCSHPQSREIIGSGIQKFEGRFLNALEPNRVELKLPGPYGQFRFDFVAVRADGTAVRLHPSRSRDATILEGRYTD